MYKSLKDRTVIITGGGRGLGREMALALVEKGAHVMITAAKNERELQSVIDDADGPGRIDVCVADAGRFADCEHVVAHTLKTFGTVHCLVNNAGRGMRLVSETFTTEPCLFWKTNPGDWQEIINCNVNGPFNMSRAVTPILVEQGFGKIINVSTSTQTMIRTGYSPYGPSKAALEAMSRSWAADLSGTGVTVNVLLPGGATDTALLPDMPDKRGADGNLLSPSLMREPICWLCADESDNHTGQRYIAKLWQPANDPNAAAAAATDASGELPRLM